MGVKKKNKKKPLWAKKHKNKRMCVGIRRCVFVGRVITCVCVYVCVAVDAFHVFLVIVAADGAPDPLACVLLKAVCLPCQSPPVSVSSPPK